MDSDDDVPIAELLRRKQQVNIEKAAAIIKSSLTSDKKRKIEATPDKEVRKIKVEDERSSKQLMKKSSKPIEKKRKRNESEEDDDDKDNDNGASGDEDKDEVSFSCITIR
jgi:hypothetical protein